MNFYTLGLLSGVVKRRTHQPLNHTITSRTQYLKTPPEHPISSIFDALVGSLPHIYLRPPFYALQKSQLTPKLPISAKKATAPEPVTISRGSVYI